LSTLLVLAVLSTVSARASHAAEIQKSGPQQYPGKFTLGVYPLGWQAAFDGASTGGYKFLVDFAAMVASPGKISIWIGGGLGYAHPTYSCAVNGWGGCAHDIQFAFFLRLTLEKLLKIPLVPYVEAGLGGDILYYPSRFNLASNTGGGGVLRVGGGIDYFILKNIGLGVNTHFAAGGASYPVAATGGCGVGASTCGAFLGNWDFLIGAKFAF